MGTQDLTIQLEGYREILQEVEALKKYGVDYTAWRGRTAQIVNALHPKRLNLEVSEIRQETDSTKSLRLVSSDGYLPPFLAGQYINLIVDVAGIRTSRPYSLASSPAQRGYYEIAVRRVHDGFVSDYLLEQVNVGQKFESTSPAGQFYHNPLFHGSDLVFLAGGSGITPFMSMIREVTDRDLDRRIYLLYGNRVEEDIIYRDELEERSRKHSNFRFDLIVSEPGPDFKGLKGFITGDIIRNLVGDITHKTFYICGPEEMYAFCCSEIERLDIPKRKIRREVMGPPRHVVSQPGWPADIRSSDLFHAKIKGKHIEVRAGEPLMNSLERAGMVLQASCRSGECSLCRTKLLSGKVFHPIGTRLRKSDLWFNYIHPCVAYPLEDLELLL
jgi:ferredoxin-NADP reductase